MLHLRAETNAYRVDEIIIISLACMYCKENGFYEYSALLTQLLFEAGQ